MHAPKRIPRRNDSAPKTTSFDASESGRVIARKGPVVTVETANGVFDCEGRGPGKKAVVGDIVRYALGCETGLAEGLVTAIADRKNALVRSDALSRKPQALAANVDRLYIVVALEPPMRPGLIDRYLVAAHAQGFEASIVYNKWDLVDDPELEDEIREDLEIYPDLGYPVYFASAENGEGLDALKRALAGECSIFVGHSGVGKTSLLNKLAPGLDLRVQDLSPASGRGQHTTTAAALFHLPSGGDLIDSPGIRGFGLWEMDPDELRLHFVEFADFAEECRFHNCRHLAEPGCAIKAAVARQEISKSRYASYVGIFNSLIDFAQGQNQGSSKDFFDL